MILLPPWSCRELWYSFEGIVALVHVVRLKPSNQAIGSLDYLISMTAMVADALHQGSEYNDRKHRRVLAVTAGTADSKAAVYVE